MDAQVLQRARADVQSTLSLVPHFATMSSDDQFALYRQLVTARSDSSPTRADQRLGRSQAMLLPRASAASAASAADRRTARRRWRSRQRERPAGIRPDRRQPPRATGASTSSATSPSDFIDAVSFPTFVSDLLEGVFRANLKVTKEQMVAYQELLKAATQSLAFFMKKIPPQESFAYLAANSDDDFSVSFPPDDGPAELTDKEGNVVARAGEEPEDATVKAKIMDATLAMAKEQRAMLREILLMGVTRLVVEKGVIRASVKFDFKATEKIDRQGQGDGAGRHVVRRTRSATRAASSARSSAVRRAARPRARATPSSAWPPRRALATPPCRPTSPGSSRSSSSPTTSISTTSPRCTGRAQPGALVPPSGRCPVRPARRVARRNSPQRKVRADDRWRSQSCGGAGEA